MKSDRGQPLRRRNGAFSRTLLTISTPRTVKRTEVRAKHAPSSSVPAEPSAAPRRPVARRRIAYAGPAAPHPIVAPPGHAWCRGRLGRVAPSRPLFGQPRLAVPPWGRRCRRGGLIMVFSFWRLERRRKGKGMFLFVLGRVMHDSRSGFSLCRRHPAGSDSSASFDDACFERAGAPWNSPAGVTLADHG